MTDPSDTFEIEDLRVLEVLNNPTRLGMLAKMSEPISVKELALELGVPATRLYYHVKAMLGVGVIKVAETRKAGAMIEKRYQVVATRFKPGPGIAQGIDDYEWAADVMAGSVLDGARLDAVNALSGHLADVSSGHPFDELHGTLGRAIGSMTREQAEAFAQKLEQLSVEMSDTEVDQTGSDYAFSFVFFPMASPLRGLSS